MISSEADTTGSSYCSCSRFVPYNHFSGEWRHGGMQHRDWSVSLKRHGRGGGEKSARDELKSGVSA